MLCAKGVLCFINPNKYLSAKYAVALREYILMKASLVKLLDVSGILVFEEAAVYPIVSTIVKEADAVSKVGLVLPRVRKTRKFELR